ncbi:hypothetical protein P9112_009686 [Eukaryota sp. TZLM1-RC]
MFVSQVFVLSLRGDCIVLKDYTGDVPSTIHNVFFRHYNNNPSVPSIFCLSDIHFAHIQRNDLIFTIASKTSSAPALLLELLYRTATIIKDYIGDLSERAVRTNFALVHEILDEIVDTGVLQDCSTDMLKPHIFNTPVVQQVDTSLLNHKTVSSSAANQSVISSKKRNDVFIDILERISMSFGSNGSLHFGELSGIVKVRSFIQGSPRLSLLLSNVPRRLENIWFPSFVNSSDFKSNSMIKFNSPEGEVSLFRYYLRDSGFRSPFRIFSFIDEQDSHAIDVTLRIRADFPEVNTAKNVVLSLPVPKQTESVSFNFSSPMGHLGEFVRKESKVLWTLEKITGTFEKSVKISLLFQKSITPNTKKQIGPLSVDYEILLFFC